MACSSRYNVREEESAKNLLLQTHEDHMDSCVLSRSLRIGQPVPGVALVLSGTIIECSFLTPHRHGAAPSWR